MKEKYIIFILIWFISINSFSQKFSIGDKLPPNSSEFKLLGISSATSVATYKYFGIITDRYFNRNGHLFFQRLSPLKAYNHQSKDGS